MSNLTSVPRVSLDQLVRGLHALPASAFDAIEKIRFLLATMPVEEASLAPYLTWNRQHYTRNLIDKTDLYELLAICWETGQSSSVHNHRDQNCWMAAPVGKLLVENFHVGFQDIEAGKCQLQASNTVELTAVNPCAVDPREPVHRVINPREANQR
jgi:cysteine dioxygenase